MITIAIRTYHKDFDWLYYCLLSIVKNVKFDYQVFISTDKDLLFEHKAILGSKLTQLFIENQGKSEDGYLYQQYAKIMLAGRVNTDYIMYIDSDCIFTKEVTLSDFILKDKPYLLKTDYSKIEGQTPWQAPTEKALCFKVESEFMRRHPFIYFSKDVEQIVNYIQSKHGVSLRSYIMSQKNREFSEFNVIGAFINKFYPDKYVILDAESEKAPRATVRQFWSWGGIKEEVIQEINKILLND